MVKNHRGSKTYCGDQAIPYLALMNQRAMISAVIFDMDGVIIDSEPIHKSAERELFHSLGINISDERHSEFVGTSSENMWEALIQEFSLTIPHAELVTQNKMHYRKKLSETSPRAIDGVSGLIQQLHQDGIKLAIASSSVPEDIELVLDLFSLRQYFNVLMSGSYVRFSKPHPEIFLRTAAMIGAPPEACLVIEDSTNGVKAAKSAGMKCIGFQNPNSGNQNLEQANYIVHTFKNMTPAQLFSLPGL